MNNMAKIFLLSFFLLTQQSCAMGLKLFLWRHSFTATFTATIFISVGMIDLFSRIQEQEEQKKLETKRSNTYKLKKLVIEFDNTAYKFNTIEKKNIQLLEEKCNFSEFSSEEHSKFYTHRKNSIKEINKITADIPSHDDKIKSINLLKDLTSLYEQTIECLEPLEEKKDYLISEKMQVYDSCFDKALAQQKENNEHETKFLEKPKTNDD